MRWFLAEGSAPVERDYLCHFGGGGGAGAGGTGRDSGGSATVYTPMAQPQADTSFQSILQGLINAGSGVGQQISPAINFVQHYLTGTDSSGAPLSGDTQAMDALSRALTAAGTGADYGTATLFPQSTAGAGALSEAGLAGLPYGTTALGQGFDPVFGTLAKSAGSNPYYGDALTAAQGAAGYGPTLQAATTRQAGDLGGYTGQMLGQAFDPQAALFNRGQNQLIDQSNAINAMSGLSGTPYGAGVTANALSNFDIDWQQKQLGRETAGLAAAVPAYKGAAALGLGGAEGAATLGALPGSTYLGNLSGQLPFLEARDKAGTGALAGYGNLLSSTSSGLSGAQSLGYGGAADLLKLASQPYQTGVTATQNTLTGLGQLGQLGQQQYTLPGKTLNALESYLKLGQDASGLSGKLGQQGVDQWGQIGQGLGGLASGANSLFGGGSGGGIGSLFGASGGAGADFGGVSALADPATLTPFGLSELGGAGAAAAGADAGAGLTSLLPLALS